MDESASLGMQWVNLCLLIFAICVGTTIGFFILSELRSSRKATEMNTQFLAQAVVALDTVNQTLPIVKGWAELGRIGGVHAREAAKEVANQTAPLSDVLKKIEQTVTSVEKAVEKVNTTGSRDWQPGDDKPKVA